jgi:methionyl-tRNA formyltransferase
MSPYPAAWTELVNGDKTVRVKVYESVRIYDDSSAYEPGRILTNNKTEIRVALRDGFIGVKTLQIAGKKRMQSDEFLRGYKFEENAHFV